MPKVSVIVPVYNQEAYLKKCLDSLVNQTLQEIEILVINDGSTDTSGTIALEYQRKYPDKVKYYEKENGGLGDSRNFGLRKATGEYIGFVDSDDWIAQMMYKSMYQSAEKEDLDIVECNFDWIYPNRVKIDRGTQYQSQKDMMIYGRVMACNKLIRRSLLEENDISFPVGLKYEDIRFFYQLVPYCKKTKLLSQTYYHYLQRDNSLSNHQTKQTEDIFAILEQVLVFYKEKGYYETYLPELEYMVIRFLLGSSFLRMVKVDKPDREELLDRTWTELNTKFPNWKQNAYLKTIKSVKNFYYRTVNQYTFRIYSKVFGLK